MADLLLSAAFDDQTDVFFTSLAQRMQGMTAAANEASGETEQGAEKSSVAMGLLAGAVGGVTAKLTDLALGAVRAFPALIAEATQLAEQAEVTGKSLITVAERAGYTAEEVQNLQKTMIDMNFAQVSVNQNLLTMLSATGNLTDAVELANAAKNVAIVLGRSEEETLTRLNRAIAMESTMVLRDLQVNLTMEDVNKRMIVLAKERGVAVESLNRKEILRAMVIQDLTKFEGASASAQAMAATEAVNLEEKTTNLKTAFGALFVPAHLEYLQFMTNTVEQLTAWFEQNKDAVDEAAQVLGFLVSKGLELIPVLLKVVSAFTGLGSIVSTVSSLTDEQKQQWADLGVTVRQALAILAAGLSASIAWVKEMIGSVMQLGKGFATLSVAMHQFTTGQFLAAKDTMVEGMLDVMGAVDRSQDSFDTARQAGQDTFMEWAEGLRLIESGGDDAAKGIKKIADETKKMEVDLTEATEAVKKLNEEFAEREAEVALRRMRQDIDRAIQEARRREDIARRTQERISKIHKDAAAERTELIAELGDEEKELLTDQATERQNLDEQSAQQLLDIETNYRRALEDIQRDWAFSAHELARKNDAVGLLRLQRETRRRLDEAGIERDRNQTDTQTDYQQQKDQLLRHQAEQRETIQIDREERIAEFEAEVAQRLADAQEAHQKELEELDRSLQRQREDIARHRGWEDEDRHRQYAKQLGEAGAQFAQMEGLTAAHLETLLAQYGGAISNIDALWEGFYARQSQRAAGAAAAGPTAATPEGAAEAGAYAQAWEEEARRAEWYQHGGFGIATQPKTVGVGDAGPEAFAAMPLSGMVSHRLSGRASIDVNGVDGAASEDMRAAMINILYSLVQSAQGAPG